MNRKFKCLSIALLAGVALLGSNGGSSPARAGSGAAFLGGMVTSHVVGGFVRRDRARTSAAMHQAYSQPQQAAAPAAPAQPAQKTVEQRLGDLDDLAKRGIITKDEYQARRKAILDSL